MDDCYYKTFSFSLQKYKLSRLFVGEREREREREEKVRRLMTKIGIFVEFGILNCGALM